LVAADYRQANISFVESFIETEISSGGFDLINAVCCKVPIEPYKTIKCIS